MSAGEGREEFAALTRLFELDEVSAAFLFDNERKLLGCAAPRNYTEQTVNQVVRFLQGPVEHALMAKLGLKDLRISYEYYTVWIKHFANRYNLAVFIRPGANLSLLRQPINLSALNLEKALQRGSERQVDEETAALVMAAHQAEMELTEGLGEGDNVYFQRLALLAEAFLGPVGQELLHHALREEQVRLPLRQRDDMERLMRRLAQNVTNVQYKKMFLSEADDLLERLDLQLQAETE